MKGALETNEEVHEELKGSISQNYSIGNHANNDTPQEPCSEPKNLDLWIRDALSFSSTSAPYLDEEIINESIIQVDNIDDQLQCGNGSTTGGQVPQKVTSGGSTGMEMINTHEDALIASDSFYFRDAPLSSLTSPVLPLTSEIISPLSTDAILHMKVHGKSCSKSQDLLEREVHASTQQLKAKQERFPQVFEYLSTLIHLAVFGIIGVLLRYALQVLCGPDVLAITSDKTALYLDFPANVLGSFLMGWFGFVFKPAILSVSELLSLGLTTGFLGSLTTFSGWIQKMLDLTTQGQWAVGIVGILVGMGFTIFSLEAGIETAETTKQLFKGLMPSGCACFGGSYRVESQRHRFVACLLFLLLLAMLWGACLTLISLRFESNGAKLWLACIFGPPGVWVRWFLARLNFKGLGPRLYLKWLPLGTLIANVGAVGIMAGLSTLNLAIQTKHSKMVIDAVELGFLGCLSTVSTLVSELRTLYSSDGKWRAYVYAGLSIGLSFGLGTLVYSVPVWIKDYL